METRQQLGGVALPGKKRIFLAFDVGEQSISHEVRQTENETRRRLNNFKLQSGVRARAPVYRSAGSRILFIGKSEGVRNPIFDLGERWNIGMNNKPDAVGIETNEVCGIGAFFEGPFFLAGEEQISLECLPTRNSPLVLAFDRRTVAPFPRAPLP